MVVDEMTSHQPTLFALAHQQQWHQAVNTCQGETFQPTFSERHWRRGKFNDIDTWMSPWTSPNPWSWKWVSGLGWLTSFWLVIADLVGITTLFPRYKKFPQNLHFLGSEYHGCGRKTFCPNEDDSRNVLSCISDISIVRHNIWLTLMGYLATFLY